MDPNLLAAAGGAVLGAGLGALIHLTHFCTMGAISDLVLFADGRRLRSWLFALAVALIGSQAAFHVLGTMPGPPLAAEQTPLVLVLGGVLFGFGMTQTGGCASRTLVRLGAGNLKAGLVLAIMIPVACTTAAAGAALASSPPDGTVLTEPATVPSAHAFAMAMVLGGLLLLAVFASARFRQAPREILGGLGIGALVAIGWLIETSLAPPAAGSATAIVPTSINVLATFGPGFRAFLGALVVAIPLGALMAAKGSGTFRIERFQSRDDRRRHAIGGLLMGVGGGLTLGCTIGHGVSGLALLTPAALLATLGMVGGGVLGIRYLEQGTLRGAVLALLPWPFRSLRGQG